MTPLAAALLLVAASAAGAETQAVRRARAALASRLAAEATVVSVEEATWPDRNLGCGPEPAKPSRPVSGYRVVLRSGEKLHTIHVGNGRAVPCGSAAAPGGGTRMDDDGDVRPPSAAPRDPRVDEARADLARRLGRPGSEIEVVKVESVTWRDGSLGCPKPGMMYTQALVPGALIVLGHGGKTYEYHAGRTGRPFLCEGARQEPLRSGQGPAS